jgi:plasmid stabilization system protein ParE
MSNVRIISPAESEYADALCWYAERSQQAAERFEAEFDNALEAISSDPHRFPRCDERHRFYLTNRYPYQIIYRVEGNEVVIIAVAHSKRRPGYWADR